MKKESYIPPHHNATDYRNKLVAQMLLNKTPVRGTLDSFDKDESAYLFLGLGNQHKNLLNGRITQDADIRACHITYFRVHESFIGLGLGTRLMRVFVAELKALGVTELESSSVSSLALMSRAKVFGKNCLQFYDSDNSDKGILPMSFEQALATNDRVHSLRQSDASDFDSPGNIGVYVDLRSIDVTDWERAQLMVTSNCNL